jgi:hypothetical protein
MTKELSAALAKVFANNRKLVHLVVQYKHAHFEDCLRIAENLICSVKADLNVLRTFNGFPIYDYVHYNLSKAFLCEAIRNFDFAYYDSMYCAIAVKLLMI